MLRFVIKPADSSFPPAEMIAHDAGDVLNLITKLGCTAANIERDGAHAFSVWIAPTGLWRISEDRIEERSSNRRSG